MLLGWMFGNEVVEREQLVSFENEKASPCLVEPREELIANQASES